MKNLPFVVTSTLIKETEDTITHPDRQEINSQFDLISNTSIVYAFNEAEALGIYMKSMKMPDGYSYVSGTPKVSPIEDMVVLGDIPEGACLAIHANSEQEGE